MNFKNFLRFLPALLWMLIIFYFSSRSTTNVPGTYLERFLFLKTLHLIEYAILAVLLFFAFTKFHLTILTGYLYALSDELHQSFIPGREGRLRDTFIDLLGIFIGIATIKILRSNRFRRAVKLQKI